MIRILRRTFDAIEIYFICTPYYVHDLDVKILFIISGGSNNFNTSASYQKNDKISKILHTYSRTCYMIRTNSKNRDVVFRNILKEGGENNENTY